LAVQLKIYGFGVIIIGGSIPGTCVCVVVFSLIVFVCADEIEADNNVTISPNVKAKFFIVLVLVYAIVFHAKSL